MRLSPAAEFAVRGVLVLTERYGQGPVCLDAVCATRKLSKQYLTKIFSLLSRADVVTAIRGKHGGYMLAREPKDISLLEVIEAVEGPIALNFCQHTPPKCEEPDCRVRPIWTELQKIIRKRLGSVTLRDCVNSRG